VCPQLQVDQGALSGIVGMFTGGEVWRCRICRCFLKVKARLPMFHCPLRYW